ncbi:uncharacterized protein METZ01_LOCUS442779, partial [marine metagenome]
NICMQWNFFREPMHLVLFKIVIKHPRMIKWFVITS